MCSLLFGRWREQGSYHQFGWEKRSDSLASIQAKVKSIDENEHTRIGLDLLDSARWLAHVVYPAVKDSHIVKQIQLLKGRIYSAEYRQTSSAGTDPIDFVLLQKLETQAIEWIQNDPLIKEKNAKIEFAKTQLAELCTYNNYARLIVESTHEREAFFNYSISENNKVAPFVQFRGTVQKLIDANISKRIGAFGGKDLQIRSEKEQKDLTLLFEGKQVSLFADEVSFKGNYAVKMNDVFKVFKERNINIGNLEYFPQLGICNWNPKHLGWFNPTTQAFERIDLTIENWWEQLVPMEIITKEEASRRYEDFNRQKLNCDGENWVGTIITTTDNHEPDAEGNHGYLQMAIPDGKGNYRLYDFGKFTAWFPKNIGDKMLFAGSPIQAAICYPDENRYNLHRDSEGVSFILSKDEGLRTMRSIKKDLIRARNGDLYFQIFIDSCVKWTFKKLKIKNQMNQMCGIRLIDGKPRGPLGKVWSVLRVLPDVIQRAFFYILFTIFGGNRKYLVKKGEGVKDHSIMEHRPWARNIVCPHPTVMLLRKRGVAV